MFLSEGEIAGSHVWWKQNTKNYFSKPKVNNKFENTYLQNGQHLKMVYDKQT